MSTEQTSVLHKSSNTLICYILLGEQKHSHECSSILFLLFSFKPFHSQIFSGFSLCSLCLFEEINGRNHLTKLQLGCLRESLNCLCTKYVLLHTAEVNKIQTNFDSLTYISGEQIHLCLCKQPYSSLLNLST